jgi:glycosyltransferase involved in cell wall biosynthesis
MKIVQIMSVLGANSVGGAERTAGIVAANLARRGHQVDLVSLGAPGSQVQHRQVSPGLTGYQLPLVQLYDPYGLDGGQSAHPSTLGKALWHLLDVYNPWMSRQMVQLLEQLQPDLVLTHTLHGFSVSVWSAVRQVGARLVHMTHDHALICPSTAMTRGARVCETVCADCSVYSHLRRWSAPVPDAVVGPSQIILDRHKRFGWFRQVPLVQAIPNVMPSDWPQPQLPVALHQPIVFGFLGRLDESKGLDILLSAVAHLPVDQWRLKVAGKGDLATVKAWLGPKGETLPVEWVGVVNGSRFLQEIDVLVTPSRAHESFCNVVMEAACLGRPSIVSASGALPERVDQGETGWIVPSGDVAALVQALQHCIAHPDEVREKGLKALATRPRYDENAQCDAFEEVFSRVMDTPT